MNPEIIVVRGDEPFGEEPSDIALMLRVRDHSDTDAFALLAGRYRTQLRRFFAALLPAAAPADDFAQETLIRLWQLRERYTPTGVFSAYLFQIARHFYLNQRERCRGMAAREISVETGGMAGESYEIADSTQTAQPETAALAHFDRSRIRRAVESLPPHYRAVFLLRHDDALSYTEIAEHLGIPVGTVKSRLSEAVRRLRIALESEE